MRRTLLIFTLIGALVPGAAQAATQWTVRGGGFGHGIGMSQYGAYGFAQNGKTYQEILAHYYRGTQLGPAEQKPVRVILQASRGNVKFRGATSGPGGKKLDPRKTYTAAASGGGVKISGVGTFPAPARVRGSGPLRLLGGAINGRSNGLYRGALEFGPGAVGGVNAVNSLSIDEYVRGVVAGEMPSSWDAEALKAQAVAARTYGLAVSKTDAEDFDLYPDTRSQVYYGVSGETDESDAAITATAGQVLRYNGEIAITYFFSTSGGRTEHVENSFLGSEPKPWLKSVPDPYDKISPRHKWRFRFSNARLGTRLRARGTLRSVKVIKRGRSPRVVRARIYGSRGTRVVTGAQIRARLGLYDSWAYFTKVSAKPARGARVAATGRTLPRIEGRFTPAPRKRLLAIERRVGGRWVKVGATSTTSSGRFLASVRRPGVYRVRAGVVTGPAVRLG